MNVLAIALFTILPLLFLTLLVLLKLHEPGRQTRGKKSPPPHRTGGKVRSPGSLDEEEKKEMLDGVRNIARTNPGHVAGLIRDWMKHDR